jgi:LacI family transcriptional regulator
MTKKYQPIKLDDLAKELNVSKVTISKALRDHPDISPETKAKVRELAERLEYTPNFMARSLSSRRSNTIGLVVPKIAHVFFASMIESIYNTAFAHNYEILLTVSQEKADRERKHIQSLLSMRVDGLLISITQETKDLSIFNKAQQLGVPMVFIDRVPPVSGVSTVTVDDRGGAYSAVDYAIKKGYTKIGHFGGYHHLNIGQARYDGFVDAMKANKLPINPDWVTEGGFSEEDGYNAFKKIYRTGDYPNYILSITYPVALGIYAAAIEYGIKVPQELEITCFGKNTFNQYFPSIFNFVNQPARELGVEGINLMIEQINHQKKTKPKHIELGTELIINTDKTKKEIIF